jgi:uncharacterized protein YkwD
VKYKILLLTSISILLLSTGCASLELAGSQLSQDIRQETNKIITRSLPLIPTKKATSEEIREIEKKVVDLINLDRQKNGLKPVSWDETAANAARQHVQEEADNGYISHWNMQGVKPQQRYTLGGGLDAVQENQSVTLWLNDGVKGISKDELYKLVEEHETSMVSEQPPEDGHRKNILDPHHTGVGVAIAVGKYGVAMAQEFTNHYIEMKPVPQKNLPGSKITLSGKILPGYSLTGIYAIWENLPQPLTKEELMKTHSYGDPPTDNLYFWARPQAAGYYIPTKAGKVMATNISVDAKGNFTLQVPLSERHQLDYISVEIAPKNNLKERFYAAQFVLEH